MKPVIIIPSRLAATRLPNKPLLMIGDQPMIVHVWRRAVESGVGEVVVACGDKEIAEAITKAGGRAVMTDADLPSGSDRVWQALTRIDPQGKYDAVINVQGDMPTLNPGVIAQSLALLSDPVTDIGTLAAVITDEREKYDPAVVKVVFSAQCSVLGKENAQNTEHRTQNRGKALYFSRATIPSGDGPLYHHIGLYAFKRHALQKFIALPPSALERREKLEQLRALESGMIIGVAVVDTVPLGVDTPETLEKARKQLCH